jgi:hypothetical protein
MDNHGLTETERTEKDARQITMKNETATINMNDLDDLQRALHNAIKTANDATRRAKDARKEAQYLSLLIKAARFKKEIGESMTPILDGIALFYRTGRRTPKDAKMFERVIREELLHAFHRHAEGLTDEEFEAENSRY